MAGVVGADGLARAEAAAGLRIVVEGRGIGERRKQIGVVGEAAAGGIGGGEVGEGQAGFEAQAMGARQIALFRVPAGS